LVSELAIAGNRSVATRVAATNTPQRRVSRETLTPPPRGIRPKRTSGESNLPGRSRVQEGAQVAGTEPLLGLDQLALGLLAVGRAGHGPEHTDGRRLERPPGQPGEHERQARLVALLVVHEDLVLAHLGDVDDLRPPLPVEHHAPLAVGPEANRLAVLEGDQ